MPARKCTRNYIRKHLRARAYSDAHAAVGAFRRMRRRTQRFIRNLPSVAACAHRHTQKRAGADIQGPRHIRDAYAQLHTREEARMHTDAHIYADTVHAEAYAEVCAQMQTLADKPSHSYASCHLSPHAICRGLCACIHADAGVHRCVRVDTRAAIHARVNTRTRQMHT